MATPDESREPRPIWALCALGTTALLISAVRLRLADFPLERDEGEYAYFAQLLLQGVAPFAEAYSMKMPGTSVAYAFALALFGETGFAIRIALLLANLAAIYLVYALGRRLVDETTGAIAGAGYGLMSLSVSVMGFAAHATHFVTLFAVGGLVLLLRALESRRTSTLLASGFALGLAYTMKQHGAVFAVFGGIWLLVAARGDAPGALLRRFALFGVAVLAPFALTAAALSASGVFERFWFWNFSYGAIYASGESLAYGSERLGIALARLAPLSGFALLAALGLAAAIRDERARNAAPFLLGLLLTSALAVAPGLHFRHHYFIPLWPAVALLAGVGASALARRANRAAALALFGAAAACLLWIERAPLFTLPPFEFSRAVYGSNPFPESIEIAEFVNRNSAPDDRIAVLGSEPQIYFYARRRSASGHIYMYGLTEVHPYSLAMQKELAAQIEAARPAFVVLVNSFPSWMWRDGSVRFVSEWGPPYLEREYAMVGVVEIRERDSRSIWGEDARSHVPASGDFIAVFERRDRRLAVPGPIGGESRDD